MEENEKEVIDSTDEETQEEVNEVEETEEDSNEDSESDDAPTLEDFKKLQKDLKTLQIQKEKWRTKAEQSATNKTEINETTSSDEEKLLKLAKWATQLDEEDLELLKTINGNSIAEKVENPLFKAYKAQRDKKKRSDASALKPSNSGTSSGTGINKPDLTPEEHKKLWEKTIR